MKIGNTFMILVALLVAHCSTVLGDYWYGDFTDSSTVVFSEDAILYSSPDLDTPIIMTVPICTAVTVSGSAGEVTVEVSSSIWDEDLGDYGEIIRSSTVYSWNTQSFTILGEGP
jgi:hypothetical protein